MMTSGHMRDSKVALPRTTSTMMMAATANRATPAATANMPTTADIMMRQRTSIARDSSLGCRYMATSPSQSVG